MRHSPLQPRDLRLLCSLTEKAIDGATQKLTLSVSRLKQETKCASRRQVITSLCRLHLSDEIRATFHSVPLDSVTVELQTRRDRECNTFKRI